MIRKATEADLDAVIKIYDELHDAEESGEISVGWIRTIYPTRTTAEPISASSFFSILLAAGWEIYSDSAAFVMDFSLAIANASNICSVFISRCLQYQHFIQRIKRMQEIEVRHITNTNDSITKSNTTPSLCMLI